MCAPSTPRCRSSCVGTDTKSLNNWSRRKRSPPPYKVRTFTYYTRARSASRVSLDVSDARSLVEPGRVYLTLSYDPASRRFHAGRGLSYRGPTVSEPAKPSYGPEATSLGPDQLAWLKRGLPDGTGRGATWNVIAPTCRSTSSSMMTRRTKKGLPNSLCAGRRAAARPLALKIADLLRFNQDIGARQTVCLRPTCHYAAAHYLHARQAQFQDFTSVLGVWFPTIACRNFGLQRGLDNTFGPEVKIHQGPGLDKQNLPPSAGSSASVTSYRRLKRPDDGDRVRYSSPISRCGRPTLDQTRDNDASTQRNGPPVAPGVGIAAPTGLAGAG